MNLVLSGPVSDALRNYVVDLAQPSRIVSLRSDAYRFEGTTQCAGTQEAIASACKSSQVDHAYVNSGVKFADMKLLAIDMDSTLITIECIDEIADFAGKKQQVAAITEATMKGEIKDFAESLKQRVALLKGTPVTVLRQVFEERLTLSPGALELLSCAKRAGVYTILVSGGFTYFSDRLKEALHFDASYSNVLQTSDQELSGALIPPIVGPLEKAKVVTATMRALNCTRHNSIAIGDGANDIPMMNCVEHSIAYHAKEIVAKQARYAINFGSLQTALDILG